MTAQIKPCAERASTANATRPGTLECPSSGEVEVPTGPQPCDSTRSIFANQAGAPWGANLA